MISLGAAAEAAFDARTVCSLADRVVLDHVDWIEPEMIDHFRTWIGLGDSAWLKLHGATHLARERGISFYGHFRGEPGALDAQMHRAVLLLFADLEERPVLVLVARDLDGEDDRRTGFEQAVQERPWPFRVIGALAQPEIEAWLVSTFRPSNADEEHRLAVLRGELGFDPVTKSDRLTSTSESKRDAKRALRMLIPDGAAAEERFDKTDLADLRLHGHQNGLTAFLEALGTGLPPLFGNRPTTDRQ